MTPPSRLAGRPRWSSGKWALCPRGLGGVSTLGLVSVATVLFSLADCSSTATAPSAILITGTTVLRGVGQTSQLTAKTPSGTDVTTMATWQSANSGVATVSSTGLVTATGSGAVSVSASYGGATGAIGISVASTGTTTLTGCGAITLPGAYALVNDLTAPAPATCLSLNLIADIQLDCGGHTVSSVSLSGVSGSALTHCTFNTASASDLMDVTWDSDTLPAGLQVTGQVLRVTVSNSHVSGFGLWLQGNPTSVVITGNRFDQLGAPFSRGLLLQGGTGNQVLNNTFDGGYDGGSNRVGVDDGIVLSNESHDTIQGNTIANVWDAGVEGVNSVASTVMAGNTITNVGSSAFGAYWCTSWTDNVIRGNTVSKAPQLLLSEYGTGTAECGAGTPPPEVFAGNQIIGNTFLTSVTGTLQPGYVFPVMAAYFTAGMESGNLIEGNNFGTLPGPALTPLSAFIDGGGNICGPIPSPNPLGVDWTCGNGTGYQRQEAVPETYAVGWTCALQQRRPRRSSPAARSVNAIRWEDE